MDARFFRTPKQESSARPTVEGCTPKMTSVNMVIFKNVSLRVRSRSSNFITATIFFEKNQSWVLWICMLFGATSDWMQGYYRDIWLTILLVNIIPVPDISCFWTSWISHCHPSPSHCSSTGAKPQSGQSSVTFVLLGHYMSSVTHILWYWDTCLNLCPVTWSWVSSQCAKLQFFTIFQSNESNECILILF